MSVITEVLTGDPWELAKVVRRLGRRCRELGEKRDAAQAQCDALESEWSDCALSYKQALVKLEEALLAPAPHEAIDPPMTATEVLARQGLRWPRGFDELRRTAVEQRDEIVRRGQDPALYSFYVTEFEAKTIQEACGHATCAVQTLAGLRLLVVDGAKCDVRDFGARFESADSPSQLRK